MTIPKSYEALAADLASEKILSKTLLGQKEAYMMLADGRKLDLDALQQRLTVAEQRASDAIELLEVWRTWLGFNRESCDNGGKRIWDRIDAVVALKPAEVITPEEDHWEK